MSSKEGRDTSGVNISSYDTFSSYLGRPASINSILPVSSFCLVDILSLLSWHNLPYELLIVPKF